MLPAGGVLLGFVLLVQFGILPLSPPVVRFSAYAAFGGAALLAWRFDASRTMVAVVLLALAGRGLPLLAAGHGLGTGAGRTAYVLIAFLLPLNFMALDAIPATTPSTCAGIPCSPSSSRVKRWRSSG